MGVLAQVFFHLGDQGHTRRPLITYPLPLTTSARPQPTSLRPRTHGDPHGALPSSKPKFFPTAAQFATSPSARL